jgi:PAS domain S-box-containing protein
MTAGWLVPGDPVPAALLLRRIRMGACIALAALPFFAAADLSSSSGHAWQVLATKAVQLGLILWTVRATGRPAPWPESRRVALVFIGGLVSTACLAAHVRGDLGAMPLMLVVGALIPSVLIPWDVRWQLLLVGFIGAAGTLAYALGPGLAAAVPFPTLGVLVGFIASLYAASEHARSRRARVATDLARWESEERFRVLAETAPVLIWMTDGAGECTYLNPEWERLLGRRTAPRDSPTLWDVIHQDDRVPARRVMEEATAARRPWEVEYRILAADGRYHWLLTRGIPRATPAGAFQGYVGSAMDITARKEEAELAAAARNAALEAARLKSDFLATLSHEIRTPMHGIFGMTELALDTPDDAERRSFLERARGCAETLMALLDDILDFSRIEAGRLELADETFDMPTVVHEAIDTLSIAAARKGLTLSADLDRQLPSGLRGDPTRLRQILVNLIGNAIKFTDEGTVALGVSSMPHPRSPDTVVLSLTVTDTGIGIPRERLTTIFEAFTQVDASVSRKYGGTGLGLAITQRLVDLMGGTIDVESTEGVGSTFCVTLPLSRDAQADVAPAPR